MTNFILTEFNFDQRTWMCFFIQKTMSWKCCQTLHQGRIKGGGAAAPTGSDLSRYTGTELINHVSVRKYTSLQLFVETKRDGSWQIPLNIIHHNSLQCVQSQIQYTTLFFIINASTVTCTARRKWKWSHRCHHIILYSDTHTKQQTNTSLLHLTNYRENVISASAHTYCIHTLFTLIHTHRHIHMLSTDGKKAGSVTVGSRLEWPSIPQTAWRALCTDKTLTHTNKDTHTYTQCTHTVFTQANHVVKHYQINQDILIKHPLGKTAVLIALSCSQSTESTTV